MKMKKILYVPLDDRPVNLDDVIVQGKAAGIEVIVPKEEDIRNRMDSEKTAEGSNLVSTSSPTFGNMPNIRRFIVKNAATADGYIISADMLAYGGLIGSRRLRSDGGGDYPNYDSRATELLDVITELKQSYPDKPIYVLDTIMRLATTTYVEGVFQNAYDESRNLMRQERQVATTFEDILNGYDKKPDGSNYEETETFDKELYYNARRHKFKTNYYILDQLTRQGVIDFLAIGVDDSSTQGVQANEIAFIEKYITTELGGDSSGQNPERAIILPDADALGHSLLARMANHFHRKDEKTRYRVEYFGPEGSTIINPYEYMSVHENIHRHVDMIGGQLAEDTPDVAIIAVTAADQVASAVKRIEANFANQIPSVVIDFVAGGASDVAVTEALLDHPATGALLGYSGWNTAGNKIGIALGMGQSRYAFLVTHKHPRDTANALNAHGTLLFKRFLKDYFYKKIAIAEVRAYSREHALYENIPYADGNIQLFNSPEVYQELEVILRDAMQVQMKTLLARNAFQIGKREDSYAIRQIKGSRWELAAYRKGTLAYNNPSFIWHRAFEITLSPSVNLA